MAIGLNDEILICLKFKFIVVSPHVCYAANMATDDETVSGAEALCSLLEAAQSLGMKTAPTPEDENRIVPIGNPKDIPKQLFELVKAIEVFREANIDEVNQILDGSVTIMSLKLALFALLGWISAQGIPNKEAIKLVLHAVNGPVKPSGSINKLHEKRQSLMELMGGASPMTEPVMKI